MMIHSAGTAASAAPGRITEIRNCVSPGRIELRATTRNAGGREPGNKAVNDGSIQLAG